MQNFDYQLWMDLRIKIVGDILIAGVGEFAGFSQTIKAVYSQTEVQQCIIHQEHFLFIIR